MQNEAPKLVCAVYGPVDGRPEQNHFWATALERIMLWQCPQMFALKGRQGKYTSSAGRGVIEYMSLSQLAALTEKEFQSAKVCDSQGPTIRDATVSTGCIIKDVYIAGDFNIGERNICEGIVAHACNYLQSQGDPLYSDLAVAIQTWVSKCRFQ